MAFEQESKMTSGARKPPKTSRPVVEGLESRTLLSAAAVAPPPIFVSYDLAPGPAPTEISIARRFTLAAVAADASDAGAQDGPDAPATLSGPLNLTSASAKSVVAGAISIAPRAHPRMTMVASFDGSASADGPEWPAGDDVLIGPGSPTVARFASATVRVSDRRLFVTNNPAPIPAAAAPVPVTQTSTTVFVESPDLITTVSIAAPAASQPPAVSAGALPIHSAPAIAKIPGAHAQSPEEQRPWRPLFETVSAAPVVVTIDRGIAAASGAFSAAGRIPSLAGISATTMEDLMISNASALARVANTAVVRLSEEDTMLWQETAAVLASGVLIASRFTRGRREPVNDMPVPSATARPRRG
jgi:hypothetical protein